MRIGINAMFASESLTGMSIYTLEVASRLLRRDGYVAYSASESLHRCFPESVRYVFPSLSPAGRTRSHLLRLLWTQTILPLLAARDRLSVLYSTVSEGPLATSAPLVVTVHDIVQLAFPHLFPRWQPYFRRVLPHLLRCCAAIIVDSAHTRDELVARLGVNPRTIRVIYAGVDTQRFGPQPPGPMRARYGRYVLLVGDVRPHKNVPRALAAFDRIDSETRLVVVGRRGQGGDAEVDRAFASLRRPGRVTFAEYVAREDLPQLYSEAAALLFPSLYEGFGLPPLEAMACGTPVAASRASSIPEVCGDAARYFDPLSVEEMAGALRDVLERPGDLGERGRRRAAEFTWDRTAAEVDRILRSVAR